MEININEQERNILIGILKTDIEMYKTVLDKTTTKIMQGIINKLEE